VSSKLPSNKLEQCIITKVLNLILVSTEKEFTIYLITDHTQIIPSFDPEMRRESSLENSKQFKDLS
jgi:hypothetical protein